jgi:hypothetical protein
MSARRQSHAEQGPPVLDLLEEAIAALRTAPFHVLARHPIGVLPFVFGLLFFWFDMSRRGTASERLPMMALVLALLFVWMNAWQALFCRGLLGHLRGIAPPPLENRGLASLALRQAALQPAGLFLMPLAAVAVLPFFPAWAFFQNLNVVEAEENTGIRAALQSAWRQTSLWQMRNLLLILIFACLGFAIAINLAVTLAMLPHLLKIFLDIDTPFSTTGAAAILNSSFFVAVLALTWSCLDPLIKATYVVRAFHGASLHTGEDLLSELRNQRNLRLGRLLPLAALLFLLPCGGSAAAPMPAGPVHEPAAAVDLDTAIDKVLRQPKYDWRLPRAKAESAAREKSMIALWLEQLQDDLTALGERIQKFFDWVEEKFSRKRKPGGADSSSPGYSLFLGMNPRHIMICMVVVLAAVIIVMLFWFWRQRRRVASAVAVAGPAATVPDLEREDVGAEALPEDGWWQLAADLESRGEFRLAVRAIFLAGLAHLGQHEWIRLARHKSNRDYENELRRRGHLPEPVLLAFREARGDYERCWYGLHPATIEILAGLRQRVKSLNPPAPPAPPRRPSLPGGAA